MGFDDGSETQTVLVDLTKTKFSNRIPAGVTSAEVVTDRKAVTYYPHRATFDDPKTGERRTLYLKDSEANFSDNSL